MTARYERFKGLFFALRFLRELEPAVLISASLFSVFCALLAGILQSTYSFALLMPYRSHGLDLACAAVELNFPGNFINYTARIDIFTNDFTPKTDQDWRNTEPDDWWCLAFHPETSYAVPTNGDNFTIDMCTDYTRLRWHTDGSRSGGGAGSLRFWSADIDPGLRCRSAHNLALPTTPPDGRSQLLYSACFDYYGDTPYQDPWFPVDMIFYFFAPVVAHGTFLLLWINQKEILGGYWGTATPRSLKAKYILIAVTCLAIVAFALTVDDGGGFVGINIGLISVFGFLACNFLILAIEDQCKLVHYMIRPNILFLMMLSETKGRDPESFGAKWPLDSDTALCFFLEQGYKTKANSFIKSVLMFGVFGLIFVFMIFPEEWGARSVFTAVLSTFMLLIVKIFGGLRATKKDVDFPVMYTSTLITLPTPTEWTLLSKAAEVVESTCVTYVSLHPKQASGQVNKV